LTAFGIAAIVGAGILVPLVQANDGVLLLFSFYLRRLPVVLLPFMQVCVNGSRFSAYTYSYVAFGN
jgi:hypothetical protein